MLIALLNASLGRLLAIVVSILLADEPFVQLFQYFYFLQKRYINDMNFFLFFNNQNTLCARKKTFCELIH